MADFVHLHTHSDYSLLDAITAIPKLVKKARDSNMTALALSDHGNMFGTLKFYKECRKQGIKPIIGSEFYVSPGSRFVKSGQETGVKYYHLLLLARDTEGYRNLLELSSKSYLEGFYYRPRIDEELLFKHYKGLTCLTACLAGEIPSLILLEKHEEAAKKACAYSELFGKEHFFLELQYHGITDQKKVNEGLLAINRKHGIPVVATNDIHYLERAHARAQDIAICIGTNRKITEGNRLKFDFPEFYFKTEEEMAAVFPDNPEALRNTRVIADQCSLDIPLPGPLLPHYEVPDSFTLESYLEAKAMEGLTHRYTNVSTEMMERLKYEIDVITSMGFTGYFLIVWDFISFARNSGIPVGPGRGSGAGSLVAYCLGITDIDPLKYGLLFERFLNPERISMPDFDIDFCFSRRGEVIDYVTGKYGKDRVSQIITFGTLKARAVIRDVARVLDIPYEEADGIAKLVPTGPKVDLEAALDMEPRLRDVASRGPVYEELISASRTLEGLCRHASTHAAGIVIGREPLTHYVPLYRDPKTGQTATQFTMDYLEECGLVKMDFLGLKTLTLIQNTLELLKRRGIDINISTIPEQDTKTFKMLSLGKSACVFQFESPGMQNILKRARPEKIEDLIALNALYRPGPMENIDQFVTGKHNWSQIQYPLPELEPILKETYGVIVYQEQVMQIAQKIAGYSLGQADILRRAMGKKKLEVMAEQKEKFLAGATANGYQKDIADKLFELLVPFAGYGFNKSHAAAYSLLAYQTAFLKANYPAEFMAANLTNEIQDLDKLAEYIRETRDMGIEILPPDINLSEGDFAVTGGKIIYGLIGIKNVGTAAVEEIIRERTKRGPFKALFDFLERVSLKVVNKKTVEALLLAGVLDPFGETRATLFHNLEQIMQIASRRHDQREGGQGLLFEDMASDDFATLNLTTVPEWPKMKLLMDERDCLGFFFSGHPLDDFKKYIERYTTLNLAEKENLSQDRLYTVIGLLKNIKEIITKTGKRMAFAEIEDMRGSIECILFSDIFEKCRELLKDREVVAVRGKIDTSRGDAKLKVEEMLGPDALAKKAANAVHIRLSKDLVDEDNSYRLRDFLSDQKGGCRVFFHIEGNGEREETVIRATAELSVSADPDILFKLRGYPQVIEVWSE
ncbi:MAG: DNA polymerase III subunit alpha [Spirochaetaceae bacterium]|nr:MAG: DNA polymerase III subunit alpha [Spirochaetaceae bacterium]